MKKAAAASVRDDSTATIAASVPRSVAAAVKEIAGERGFSRFVTAALERELRHIARAEIVADVVKHSGPLDPVKVKAARKALRK